MAGYTAHVDTFARDHLPPREQWPDLIFTLPELRYPDRLNAAVELLDRHVREGRGGRTALISPTATWSYAELQERVNRIARVLADDFGLLPGERVLLRSANNPMMAALHFAVLKAGGIVVATMPLLRARELGYIIAKARIRLAVSDARLADEIEKARAEAELDALYFGTEAADGLEARMNRASTDFRAVDTAAEDVCLIAFTSGTTGVPKGTMHFHRDLLAVCDTYGAHVLRPEPDDRFIGSPPLAFTFGLGGLVLFPFRVGAASVLLEKATPDDLLPAFETFRASVCFTAPTGYRAMLGKLDAFDLASLRTCVSAGEALSKAIAQRVRPALGCPILDGLGSTEVGQTFVSNTLAEQRDGTIGRALPPYEVAVRGPSGEDQPAGQTGTLWVRGPTVLLEYLDRPDATAAVKVGDWLCTGDRAVIEPDGFVRHEGRVDDMEIVGGINIGPLEIEALLAGHPAVSEVAVAGVRDELGASRLEAFVVLGRGTGSAADVAEELVALARERLAPHKVPRAVRFVDALPRTPTGKLRRFILRSGEWPPKAAGPDEEGR